MAPKTTYLDMVKEAIAENENKDGTSLQAIKNYIGETYEKDCTNKSVKTAIKTAIQKGEEAGELAPGKSNVRHKLSPSEKKNGLLNKTLLMNKMEKKGKSSRAPYVEGAPR